jgi:hypothetical protein
MQSHDFPFPIHISPFLFFLSFSFPSPIHIS